MKVDRTRIEEESKVRRGWTAERTLDYVKCLPIWEGDVEVRQVFGGLQNRTFFATTCKGARYAVRVGFDQFRTRQTSVVQCTIAAHTLGLGPRLVYAEPNLTVTEFVDGTGVTLEQMKDLKLLKQVIDRMRILHEGAHAVQETISYWWPFDSVRRYLRSMEVGKEATGFNPSRWVGEIPRFHEVTNRLEKVIAPFIPKLTHNDMVFVNMIINRSGELMFIDWDGGAYGHPMWDLGEMLMWAEADAGMCRDAVRYYYGVLSDDELKQRLREIRAFQVMAALRLVTEVMEADLDPYYFLTPVEVAQSMKVTLPGQKPEMGGLADLLLPRFEMLWKEYAHEFAAYGS
jgi:thiamine kinase-like enzyme